MPSFAAGVVKFQGEIFPEKKALFEKLARGQKPEALFITCSDSRIETGMITQTDPGELFVCRNPGNIVPPYKIKGGGVTASIEFAVEVLDVVHIVICGHTDCGAVNGALNPQAVSHLPHVSEWLSYVAPAVARTGCSHDSTTSKGGRDDARLKAVTEENVVLQLENLAGHPSVGRRLASGALKTHGWNYDIKTGQISVYDSQDKMFIPIEEKYAERFAGNHGT